MTKINLYTVRADEIEHGIFVVMAKSADGRWLYHEGPKNFAFFTKEEAANMVARVIKAGEVNEQFWISGGTGYGTAAHEYALMECEYYEG
jgi:hypothetical protein